MRWLRDQYDLLFDHGGIPAGSMPEMARCFNVGKEEEFGDARLSEEGAAGGGEADDEEAL